MLGPRLLSYHNVAFLVDLVARARAAIQARELASWSGRWTERYLAGAMEEAAC
jgi:queuine tRNA-ribosyltransferase